MRFDTVIFDLDGTLTDPYEGISHSILHALRYYPQVKTPSESVLRAFIGPPLKDMFRDTFGFTDGVAAEAVEHYREYFKEKGLFENRVYDGIPALLRSLKEGGAALFVATSKPEVFAARILKKFELFDSFDRVVGSFLDGGRVEKEDVIRAVLAYSRGTRIAMVGDRKFDVVAAKKCGLTAVGVSYGYGSASELQNAGADVIISDVLALQQYLMGDDMP